VILSSDARVCPCRPHPCIRRIPQRTPRSPDMPRSVSSTVRVFCKCRSILSGEHSPECPSLGEPETGSPQLIVVTRPSHSSELLLARQGEGSCPVAHRFRANTGVWCPSAVTVSHHPQARLFAPMAVPCRHNSGLLTQTGVAVEKLIFLKNLPKFGDRKCPDDPRESFIAHPDAILFLRFSLSGVFQQPQAFTPTTG
jgi:hypothetical protein